MRRVDKIAFIAPALGLAGLVKPAAWVPVVSFLLAAGIGIGALTPSMAVRIAAAAPMDRAARALGCRASFANIGQAMGAAATGWLYGIDIGAPILLGAVVVLVDFAGYSLSRPVSRAVNGRPVSQKRWRKPVTKDRGCGPLMPLSKPNVAPFSSRRLA